MDVSRIDAWTAIVSESPAAAIEKLSRLVDFADPPDFFEFACRQWVMRSESGSGAWDLLMEAQCLVRAVAHPTVLPLAQALTLTGFIIESDPLFDTKLLRRLLAQRLWPEEVPPDQVMRTLEILETLKDARRLSMTLLKFSKYPDPRIQSKVAKILGRCIDSVDVMEDLFANPDARVRANLIEGILRRQSLDQFLPMIERAARDQHPRVSSLALAVRSRFCGHNGAGALVQMRAKSKVDDIRRSAEYARRIVDGEPTGREVTPMELPASVPASGEPAVAAAIEEVNEQAEAHPDEQAQPVL